MIFCVQKCWKKSKIDYFFRNSFSFENTFFSHGNCKFGFKNKRKPRWVCAPVLLFIMQHTVRNSCVFMFLLYDKRKEAIIKVDVWFIIHLNMAFLSKKLSIKKKPIGALDSTSVKTSRSDPLIHWVSSWWYCPNLENP